MVVGLTMFIPKVANGDGGHHAGDTDDEELSPGEMERYYEIMQMVIAWPG